MNVPYLDLRAQYRAFSGEIVKELEAVCESSQFAQGPPVAKFEQAFAAYCEVPHAIAVNSGTSALHLALHCLDIGPGDEVITVPLTFVATAWAISYVGARPVFVDVDRERRTMDPGQLEAAITSRTKAILPVHLFGQPAAMDEISAIAARHGLPIVEDAAQAHGARYRGKRVGQFGEMACFSFYPGKNLGAYGEGGALVTGRADVAQRAASLRNHAQVERYRHEELGYNYRMDSFQAAVLNIKLPRLDAWNDSRRRVAARYSDLLRDLPYGLPAVFSDSESVWHCYVIESERRDALREHLLAAGIETAIHYPIPLHLQPAYSSLKHERGHFPVSEAISDRCLSLPIYPELGDEAIDHVVACLRDFARRR